MRALLLVPLALAALTPGRAAACSVRGGYKVPTALQLVEAADTIVVAAIDGERRCEGTFDGAVILRPTTLLKGAALPGPITIERAVIVDRPDVVVTRSDPRELRRPNPDTLGGGCGRYLFRRDMRLVLFLKRDGAGGFVPIRSPFSRDAEDVAGDDALWVRAVREYVAIEKGPLDAQDRRLAARAATLRARGDAASNALADDMLIEREAVRERGRSSAYGL